MVIKAIFFDLDGVLVDSELPHQKLAEAFLKEEHSPIPPERFTLLIGSHKTLDPWPKIMENIELTEPLDQFKQRFRDYKQKHLKTVDFSLLIFPEVKEQIDRLKAMGLRLACASSSAMPYIQHVLHRDRLIEAFDLVVSCDDFTHSKPEPDTYLYCLQAFQFKKQECLVVEDSPIGIEAGKRAGLQVAARADHRFGLDQSKADFLIEDLCELTEWLAAR